MQDTEHPLIILFSHTCLVYTSILRFVPISGYQMQLFNFYLVNKKSLCIVYLVVQLFWATFDIANVKFWRKATFGTIADKAYQSAVLIRSKKEAPTAQTTVREDNGCAWKFPVASI